MFLNTVNIILFYKMGLSDGVARNFFILALSDCLYAAVAFLNKLLIILRILAIMYIGYGGLEQVINTIFQATFYCGPYQQNFSLITTCVIAVVRCCCVAMPLKVKYLLTARHQLIAILFFFGYCHLYFGVRYGSNEAYLSTKSENKHYPRLFCWGTLVHICSIQQFSFLRKFHHLYRMCYYSLGQSS